MLPGQALSASVDSGSFLGPRSGRVDLLVDHEWGGADFNDPTMGPRYQPWWCVYACGQVVVGADSVPATVMYEAEGITEISFCFDQNMNFNLAFIQNDQAKIWWYDTTINDMRVTSLAADVENPRLSLDDKRDIASNINDLILAYIRGTGLYYRQQRDRYETEYLLSDSVPGPLLKVGMNNRYRFQFEFAKGRF